MSKMKRAIGVPYHINARFCGHVEYSGDLEEKEGSYGDIYAVIYQGKRTDHPKDIKRIDGIYMWADGWTYLAEDEDYYKEYQVFTCTLPSKRYSVVVELELNKNDSSMRITNIYPYELDTPETKLQLLPEVLSMRPQSKVHTIKGASQAYIEFMSQVAGDKVRPYR